MTEKTLVKVISKAKDLLTNFTPPKRDTVNDDYWLQMEAQFEGAQSMFRAILSIYLETEQENNS